MYRKSRGTHSLRATSGEIPDPLSYAGELSPHCIPCPGTVVKGAHNMTMGVQLQLPEGERKAVSPAPLPMGLLPPGWGPDTPPSTSQCAVCPGKG